MVKLVSNALRQIRKLMNPGKEYAGKYAKVDSEGHLGFADAEGGVTKQYVDDADATTLATAKAYTDDEIADIQYIAGDGIDISGNVISSLVKSLEFVSYNELILSSLPAGYGGHIVIQNLDNNYDYFIFVEVNSGSHCIAPSFVTRGGSSIELYVFNKGGADLSGMNIGQYTIYRVKKKENWNYIHIIGSLATNANMVPMGGDAGEVLYKISGTNYSVSWKTIGKTITTTVLVPPTATLTEIYNVLSNATIGTEFVFNKLTYTIGSNTYGLSGKFTKVEPTRSTISAMFIGGGVVSSNDGSPTLAPMLTLESGDIKVYDSYNIASSKTISTLTGTTWDIIVMTYN